jgi:DNA-binding PadR family transcriptional regulator
MQRHTISIYDIVQAMPPPVSSAMLHILLALAGGKRHGYAIAQDVAEQTDGRVRIGPGTLYGTLQKLLNAGWVAVSETPADVDERRRYYRLTASGKATLESEIRGMEILVRRARALRPKSAPLKP